MKSKFSTLCFISLLFFSIYSIVSVYAENELDGEEFSDSYKKIYSQFMDNLLSDDGITKFLNNDNDPILTGEDQGFGIVSFLQLYDIFGTQEFLTNAETLADIIYTNFQDPRFDLIGSYYNKNDKVLGNTRNAIDNFLIAWALDELVYRIDPDDLLKVRDYERRAQNIVSKLDSFKNDFYFVDKYRVEVPVESSTFNVYTNLMIAFIVLESGSQLFEEYVPIIEGYYNFILQNLQNEDGGVYSLYYNGFHDTVVTLRNTALFANIGFELYKLNNNQSYLDAGIASLNYIKKEFADLGTTRGYFETIVKGELTQLSKSLFSHSILLLAFIKSANLGNTEAKLDLLSLWTTINNYFKDGNRFYSTIDRHGEVASQDIRSSDNLMIIFALSRFPTLATVQFHKKVDFRDQQQFRITYIIPDNVSSIIRLKYDEKTIKEVNITGNGNVSTYDLFVDLKRPSSDQLDQNFRIEIDTLDLTSDYFSNSFVVTAKVGIELNPSTIMLFSAVLIFFLVLLLNEVSKTLGSKDSLAGVDHTIE